MENAFETALLVFGSLLVVGALLSGLAHRSFLSLTALFVVVGFVLGDGGLEVLHFETESAFVEDLALVALVVILFRDGLEVEADALRNRWRLPLRKLVVAMPLTCLLIAGTAKALFADMSWLEALLLGALLAPTDPVLTSSIVTNSKVPSTVRSSLNLESGLNDGLALPAVLAFAAALGARSEDGEEFVWWQFVAQDVGLGVVYGIALGLLGAALLPSGRDRLPRHLVALFGFGFAFVAYAVAHIGPHGNGLIAVFVCAITLGIRREDVRHAVEEQTADVAEMVKLGIFVVFGSLLTLGDLFSQGVWTTLAFIAVCFLLARPLAILVALAGSRQVDLPTKLFIGWFGPKGIATMAFGLLVLSSGIPEGPRLFELAAVVVFFSIVLHGSSDTYGARWMAGRARPGQSDEVSEPT